MRSVVAYYVLSLLYPWLSLVTRLISVLCTLDSTLVLTVFLIYFFPHHVGLSFLLTIELS